MRKFMRDRWVGEVFSSEVGGPIVGSRAATKRSICSTASFLVEFFKVKPSTGSKYSVVNFL